MRARKNRRNSRPPRSAVPRQPRRALAGLDTEELGAILRHEINNPLTGILGNAELILAVGTELPAEVQQRAQTIVELAVRLRRLTGYLEQLVSGQTGEASAGRPSAPSALEPAADRPGPAKR